jgi:hypothetical protein
MTVASIWSSIGYLVIKRPSPKSFDDGLAFDRTAGIIIRIDGWATRNSGGYSPSEYVGSIQKKKILWLRILLFALANTITWTR